MFMGLGYEIWDFCRSDVHNTALDAAKLPDFLGRYI